LPATHRVVLLLRVVVVLLSAQFLLGIWVNLFGRFPATRTLGSAVLYGGDPVLTTHYLAAVALLIVGMAIVVAAFRHGVRESLRWLVVAGFLSIVWACASGLQFVLSGFSDNVDSFSMAVAFIAATSFYGVAQALVLPAHPPAGSPSREEGSTRAARDPPGEPPT